MKTLTLLFLMLNTTFMNAQIMTKKYNPSQNIINWPDEYNPTKTSFYVYNEININASPEKVWKILIDAEKWSEFYVGAENIKIIDGSSSLLNSKSSFQWKTMGLDFVSEIKEFETNSKLSWLSNKKSIKGYHAWLILPTNYGCRLITAESQKGFLTLLQKIFKPKKLLKLHDIWLKGIKLKAEKI